MPKKPHPFEDKCCEEFDEEKDPIRESVLGADKILNTIKNMVASVCMEAVKKEGGNFRDARKIADEAFKRFLLNDKYHTNEDWASFFVEYLGNRNIGVSDEALTSLGIRLEAFGSRENMSSLVYVRAQCEKLLKTQKDKLSKGMLEKLRQILFDLTPTHF